MTSRPATGLTPVAQAAEPSRTGGEQPVGTDPTDPAAPASPSTPSPTSAAPPGSDRRAPIEPVAAAVTAAGRPTNSRRTADDDDAALPGDSAKERHRLAPRVKRYWRWRVFFSAIPVLGLLIGLAIVIPWGPPWVRWGIVGIAAGLVVVAVVVLPPIRYRVFWYAISATEIDIQHKIIFVERSVIPMHRVQGLQTERGPLADHYRMTNLKIKTAGGSVSISGLDRDEANALCDRISKLADVADDV